MRTHSVHQKSTVPTAALLLVNATFAPSCQKERQTPVLSCLRCMETYVFEIVLVYLLISHLIFLNLA